jgi:CheY-like chemotaxis protein
MYKVLCVEDETGFREDVADFLRMQSYEVDEASNGREALQKMEMGAYDLILSDIKMPEMDGFSMCQSLPKDAPPVVFLSALNDHETLVESHELGCADFLTKPVNFKVLLAALQHRIRARGFLEHNEPDQELSAGHMLANCMQYVLSKPLLQISEAAYYLTSLPDDAPFAKALPILEMVKNASNVHLDEMALLQAGLSIPTAMPDSAIALPVNKGFLGIISTNVPHIQVELMGPDTDTPPHIHAKPDWIVRGFSELLRSCLSVKAAGKASLPCLRYRFDEDMVYMEFADGEDVLNSTGEYISLGRALGSSAVCEALCARLLALLYLHSVAQVHGGALDMKCGSDYRLAACLTVPQYKPH